MFEMDSINLIPQAAIGTKPMGSAQRQTSASTSAKQTPVLDFDRLYDRLIEMGAALGFSPMATANLICVYYEVEAPNSNAPEEALRSYMEKLMKAASAEILEAIDEMDILIFYFEFIELVFSPCILGGEETEVLDTWSCLLDL